MNRVYKVEIMLSPDDNYKSFFWCLLSNTVGDYWCNEGYGYESSPEKAWVAANSFYKEVVANDKL